MPPRRKTNPPKSVAPEGSPQPLTAARRVWSISHIRQMILQDVNHDGLAKCMRVEKESFHDVARELYRVVGYSKWKSDMCSNLTRQRKYCAAISEIVAFDYTLPAAMRAQLNLPDDMLKGSGSRTRQAAYFRHYHAEVMSLLLPHMREICPSLRVIRFGEKESAEDNWVVRLFPIPANASAPTPAGHIDYFHSVTLRLHKPPPSTIECPPAPSGNYTIRHRFNLALLKSWGSPDLITEWVDALRTAAPWWGDLYKSLQIVCLPVALGDLARVIQRQIDAGHSERLSDIWAPETLPWSIPDFRDFARIASASMTSLELAGKYPQNHPHITFADLSDFIFIIRSNLRSLQTLHMAMGGIEEAETLCQEMLHDRILCEGGTLRKLVIHTAPWTGTLFNVIRACAPLMVMDSPFSLDINAITRAEEWSCWEQGHFLDYLRQQPQKRRIHLATVSFPSLDVFIPSHASGLEYDGDGRPRGLHEAKATVWAQDAKDAFEEASSELLPNLEKALQDYSRLAESVRRMKGAQETGPRVLEESRNLLTALRTVREAAEVVGELALLDGGHEIHGYVAALEDSEGNYMVT